MILSTGVGGGIMLVRTPWLYRDLAVRRRPRAGSRAPDERLSGEAIVQRAEASEERAAATLSRYGTEIARFWRGYSRRYLSEMRRQRPLIDWLSALERDFGLTLTLLCACDDHRLCHRSLLADLIVNSPSPKPRS
ncbi:MAG: DUF488 family protein, N3 subclade [Gammaproteobacteria bacterium]